MCDTMAICHDVHFCVVMTCSLAVRKKKVAIQEEAVWVSGWDGLGPTVGTVQGLDWLTLAVPPNPAAL